MDIALELKWALNSINRRGNVIGDELYARSLREAFLRTGRVRSCELTAPRSPLAKKVDILIHFNDTIPDRRWAEKHILYLQNGYGYGSYPALRKIRRKGYDGYAFISNTLLAKHQADGFSGIWMPFGVDTNFFRPRAPAARLNFDVAYVGNDIKGTGRTMRFIYPAVGYNFGLFGNWRRPSWKRILYDGISLKMQPTYRRVFAEIGQGKIPQDDVPVLYSSAKINLNCTLQDCVDWDVITLRTFEVLACGGFLITDEVPSLKQVCGDAVVITTGEADLQSKIEYYLSHEHERNEVAALGPDIAQRYSVDAMAHRFVDYLEEVA